MLTAIHSIYHGMRACGRREDEDVTMLTTTRDIYHGMRACGRTDDEDGLMSRTGFGRAAYCHRDCPNVFFGAAVHVIMLVHYSKDKAIVAVVRAIVRQIVCSETRLSPSKRVGGPISRI